MQTAVMNELPTLAEIKQEWSRRHILDFTQYTFHDYQVNWHHEAICEVLDDFIARKIRRLMIFTPPRMGKSELVSRRLPAKILGQFPDVGVMACSYNAGLASRMNRDVQRIIDSKAYHEVFPETVLPDSMFSRKTGDVKNNSMFELVDHDGRYICAGVGGGITGEGFHYGIIDDPIKNWEEAFSETYREKIWEWYESTFYTRREKDACILLTMTRWHPDDLAGRLLKKAKQDPDADQWKVIRFPAVKEKDDNVVYSDKYDKRKPGEVLWPSKYSEQEMKKTRAGSGSLTWYSLYQQNPIRQEGGMFQRSWFEIVDQAPEGINWLRFYDLASTEVSQKSKDPDYTVGGKVGMHEGTLYIQHVLRMRESSATVEKSIKQTAQTDGKEVVIYMEQEPGASGKAVVEHYRSNVVPGYAFYAVPATGSKEMRAMPLSSLAEVGKVKLVRGEWNEKFLDEVEMFPNGTHDDQVDTIAGGYNQLHEGNKVLIGRA
jgi:predicted phage terminase large subunit-like protein